MGCMHFHSSPVSTDIKDIDVAMVIPSKERLPGCVKGHMMKAHRLALFSTADHCNEQAENEKEQALDVKTSW